MTLEIVAWGNHNFAGNVTMVPRRAQSYAHAHIKKRVGLV